MINCILLAQILFPHAQRGQGVHSAFVLLCPFWREAATLVFHGWLTVHFGAFPLDTHSSLAQVVKNTEESPISTDKGGHAFLNPSPATFVVTPIPSSILAAGVARS